MAKCVVCLEREGAKEHSNVRPLCEACHASFITALVVLAQE